jgi:hypothetical protein
MKLKKPHAVMPTKTKWITGIQILVIMATFLSTIWLGSDFDKAMHNNVAYVLDQYNRAMIEMFTIDDDIEAMSQEIKDAHFTHTLELVQRISAVPHHYGMVYDGDLQPIVNNNIPAVSPIDMNKNPPPSFDPMLDGTFVQEVMANKGRQREFIRLEMDQGFVINYYWFNRSEQDYLLVSGVSSEAIVSVYRYRAIFILIACVLVMLALQSYEYTVIYNSAYSNIIQGRDGIV